MVLNVLHVLHSVRHYFKLFRIFHFVRGGAWLCSCRVSLPCSHLISCCSSSSYKKHVQTQSSCAKPFKKVPKSQTNMFFIFFNMFKTYVKTSVEKQHVENMFPPPRTIVHLPIMSPIMTPSILGYKSATPSEQYVTIYSSWNPLSIQRGQIRDWILRSAYRTSIFQCCSLRSAPRCIRSSAPRRLDTCFLQPCAKSQTIRAMFIPARNLWGCLHYSAFTSSTAVWYGLPMPSEITICTELSPRKMFGFTNLHCLKKLGIARLFERNTMKQYGTMCLKQRETISNKMKQDGGIR